MTALSKANIEAAIDAKLVPSENGGYQVELVGQRGTAFVENAQGPIAYSSMASAKTAVQKHNSTLKPTLKPTI